MLNTITSPNTISSAAPATETATVLADPIAYARTKQEILTLYGVVPSEQFDAAAATSARIAYLKSELRRTGRRGYVLGISGGVDSTTCGRLAQLACEELRAEGFDAQFYAVRLPAGVQRDEDDAQEALRFINPDHTLTINIGEGANVMNEACMAAVATTGTVLTPEEADYHKGNIKARLRMTAQYHLAAVYGGLVLGTDHAAEATMGYFSKHADGACDLLVINGLNKRQVRACAEYLGAPAKVWQKAPTADLEELAPGKLDDEGFGFPYVYLDDFLEGKQIELDIEAKIVTAYDRTRHKRLPIVEFAG